MTDDYVATALDKRIEQARERVKYPATGDSPWTIELLGYLADEAEAAQRYIAEMESSADGDTTLEEADAYLSSLGIDPETIRHGVTR